MGEGPDLPELGLKGIAFRAAVIVGGVLFLALYVTIVSFLPREWDTWAAWGFWGSLAVFAVIFMIGDSFFHRRCPHCGATWGLRKTGATRNEEGVKWEEELRCKQCERQVWIEQRYWE